MEGIDRKNLKRKADRDAIKESQKLIRLAELQLAFTTHDSDSNEDGLEEMDVALEIEDNEVTTVSAEETTVNDEENEVTTVRAEETTLNEEAEDFEIIEQAHENVLHDNHDERESDYGGRSDKDNSDGQSTSDEEHSEEEEDYVAESDIEAEGNRATAQPAHNMIDDPEKYVLKQVYEWAVSGGVTMGKVDELLRRLKPVHPILPLSYKTLLRTPKQVCVVDCGNGSMWYFGITPQLHRIVSNEYFDDHQEIAVDINIDSLPIFNRSNANFVPILGRLLDVPEPFIVGIFCGDCSDPKDLDTFLNDFVEEVNFLSSNGFMFENVRHSFKTRNYILDQKARASIKRVKGVRGYYCCEKCTVKGVDHMNRMCLLNHDCPLRTDESFLELASALMTPHTEHFDDDDDDRDEHVIGLSPLLGCEQRLVSKFRLDSMHLVYKGVFLRWMDFLWAGRGDYSLSIHERQEISSMIGSFREHCPCDFNRKPYAFTSLKLKATELRRILLYDGLLAFKKLDKNIYQNFLLLHSAIYILCSSSYHYDLNDEANEFLRSFVIHAEAIFGAEFIVYNVHSLVHLAAECKEHGRLDEFGAFPFENKLGLIKAKITSRSKPLQQIAKREIERSTGAPKPTPKAPKNILQIPCVNNPEEHLAGQQYEKINLKSITLSVHHRDSCFSLKNGSVMVLKNIIDSDDGPILKCQKFSVTDDFYNFPIPSSLLGIVKVSEISACTQYIKPEDVHQRCYRLPISEGQYLCIPLAHCI